jgi:hypothetical protein
MPFFEQTLKQGVEYDINVDASGAGAVAITILKINKRDRLAAAEQHTVVSGARTTVKDTAGLRIDRVIIHVHPAGNNTVSVEVKQGAVAFSQTCTGDTDIVFDTVV